MAEILAEAGRVTGPVTEISDTIVFGLQSAYARMTGQKPMTFAASADKMAGLGEHDLIVVRFRRADFNAAAGPVPVASLSLA